MHSKRQMLEDIFKVSLPVNDRGHVDIATARPALEEPAAKSWQNHLGEENVQSNTLKCSSHVELLPHGLILAACCFHTLSCVYLCHSAFFFFLNLLLLLCWITSVFPLVHEKKCISRGETVAPANQSKLSRVSSGFGLSKLTGSRRSKKESGMNKNNLSAQVTDKTTFTDVEMIAQLIFWTCTGSLCSHLVLTVHRKPSSGCSRTLLWSGTW